MTKFIFLSLLFILFGCQSGSRHESQKLIELITPSGEKIETVLAITPEEQTQGLSGVKSEDFKDNQGMLFFYTEEDERSFWMPDTYFDLDLFYLDQNLKITDIIRKLPHYVGRANPNLIPRARSIWARHVLEMKSSSPLAAKLMIGHTLQWKSSKSLSEMENEAREELQRKK